MTAELQIPSLVLEHSRFFDHLVELIPARFYHEEEAPTKLRYVPKQDRQKEIEVRKAKSKAAKLARLNPDTAQTALQIQQQKLAKAEVPTTEESPETSAQEEDNRTELNTPKSKPKQGGPTLQLEALRGRLTKRLQDFRQQRKADERKSQTEKAKQYREKSRKVSATSHQQHTGKRKGPPTQSVQQPEEATPNHLSYGTLDFGEDLRRGKRQKKASKADLLQDAERKAAAQQDLASSATGQAQLQKEAWSSAMARARGERVYDDPKLLRRSLKRDEKQRNKSATAWKQRHNQQQQQGKEKQQKRRENLQARVDAKRQKKISKREKKLMRPGFEGRRDTFINGP